MALVPSQNQRAEDSSGSRLLTKSERESMERVTAEMHAEAREAVITEGRERTRIRGRRALALTAA